MTNAQLALALVAVGAAVATAGVAVTWPPGLIGLGLVFMIIGLFVVDVGPRRPRGDRR